MHKNQFLLGTCRLLTIAASIVLLQQTSVRAQDSFSEGPDAGRLFRQRVLNGYGCNYSQDPRTPEPLGDRFDPHGKPDRPPTEQCLAALTDWTYLPDSVIPVRGDAFSGDVNLPAVHHRPLADPPYALEMAYAYRLRSLVEERRLEEAAAEYSMQARKASSAAEKLIFEGCEKLCRKDFKTAESCFAKSADCGASWTQLERAIELCQSLKEQESCFRIILKFAHTASVDADRVLALKKADQLRDQVLGLLYEERKSDDTDPSGLTCWSKDAFPLKVHVQNHNPLRDAEFRRVFLSSLDEWVTRTNHVISYVLTDDPQKANIIASYIEDTDKGQPALFSGNTVGVTNVLRYDKYLRAMDICVSLGQSGRNFDPAVVRTICLHEIGHSIGIIKHAQSKQSCMYPQCDGNLNPKVSDFDSNLIKRMYSNDWLALGHEPPPVSEPVTAVSRARGKYCSRRTAVHPQSANARLQAASVGIGTMSAHLQHLAPGHEHQ